MYSVLLSTFSLWVIYITLVQAAPIGILGLGNQGGQRDNSNNVNQFNREDIFLAGQDNFFTPALKTGGIDGVGRSRLL